MILIEANFNGINYDYCCILCWLRLDMCCASMIRLWFVYSPVYKIHRNLYKYTGSVCTGNSIYNIIKITEKQTRCVVPAWMGTCMCQCWTKMMFYLLSFADICEWHPHPRTGICDIRATGHLTIWIWYPLSLLSKYLYI